MTVPLRKYRFTVADYHRMAHAGILGEGDRVELIDGEIIEMSPIGSRHAACVNRLTRLLVTKLGDRAVVAVQNPVRLSDLSEPQPDFAVLRPRQGAYADRHPGPADILLLIEVADTSLPVDEQVKAPLYAMAGIPELWIVDLGGRSIEVLLDPTEQGYRTAQRVRGTEAIRPFAFSDVEFVASDILA